MGQEILSCNEITSDQHLFLVPQGRIFVWPTFEIGHKAIVSRVVTNCSSPIEIVTLSQHPRLFRLLNFFSEEEADELMAHALTITEEDYRLQRSTTGQDDDASIVPDRTSDSAFDLGSEVQIYQSDSATSLLRITTFIHSCNERVDCESN